MKEIYLDNSATTKPSKKAIENATYAMETLWGNPSSLYIKGFEAEKLVTRAREGVARVLSAKAEEIFFTSCGTEANNTAIFGAVEKLKKRGNRIVVSSIEHPSVLEPARELERRGFQVVYLPVNSEGKVTEEALREAINEKTILVSLMAVNNETGAIQPIDKVKGIINAVGSPALFHCDAVQAFGKKQIDVNKLGVDLLTLSGHKIHAPKGIGVLYKKKGVTIPPYLFGGGQEKGFRSGTEAVPLIYALLGAVEELRDVPECAMDSLWGYAKEKLAELEGVVINSPADALPYIMNISVLGYRSETLLHFLEAEGIYVSSGSACSKGAQSGVLSAMGISRDRADSALRISFSKHTTAEDIDEFCRCIRKAQGKLKRK